MTRRAFSWLLLLVPTLLSASDVISLEKRVVEHTCPNGIKVLILERHFSPTVAIRLMFRTGSVDETSGKTGLAHMFEHMMFKGTETLGTKNFKEEVPLLREIDALHRRLDEEKAKGSRARQDLISKMIEDLRALEAKASTLVIENELWNIYEREGASGLNASTSHDYTQYVIDIPSNKLELWAMIDSDRIRHPVFRQFYQEREVVKEERRMRVDTDPGGKLFEEFLATSYSAHPYRHPTIGWESDLEHLNVGDLEDFYRRYYTPDQLTIAIVGDVRAADAISLVDRYFGTWKNPRGLRPTITREPPQSGPRIQRVFFDAQPTLLMGYHIPTYPDPDHVVTYAIAQLLANGTTSRLYKRLVQRDKLATSVDTNTDYPGERYDSLFILSAAPRHPHTARQVASAMEEELARLTQEPVSDWELQKVRASVDVAVLDTLQTNGGMAGTLVYDQTIFGDWKYLLRFQDQIKRLSASDIQRAAQRYFRPENQTLAVLEPTGKGGQKK